MQVSIFHKDLNGSLHRGLLFLALLLTPLWSLASGEEGQADSLTNGLGGSFLIFQDWGNYRSFYPPPGYNELGFTPFYRFWYKRWGVQIGFKPFREDLNDGRNASYGVLFDLHFEVTKGNTLDLIAYQGNSFLYYREAGACYRVASHRRCYNRELEEKLNSAHRLGIGMDLRLIDRFGMTLIGSASFDRRSELEWMVKSVQPMAKASFYYRF